MGQQPTLSPEEFAKQLGGTVGEAPATLSPEDFAKHLGGTVGEGQQTEWQGPIQSGREAFKADPWAGPRRAVESLLPSPAQAPPMAGAMIGAARGAQMGAPLGPVAAGIGGLAGAGIGAAGGEGVQIALEKLARYFGLMPEAPSEASIPERIGEASKAGVTGEALGQGGAAALNKIGTKVLAPVANKMTSYAREALATFPGKVLPSEVSDSRLLGIAENVAEGSIFGGERINRIKAARQAAAQDQVMKVLDRLGPSVTERQAGETVLERHAAGVGSARKGTGFRGDEKLAWDAFRTQTENMPASTPALDQFISELHGREAGSILPNAGHEAARRIAALTENAGEMKDILTSDARKLMSTDIYKKLSPASQKLALEQTGAHTVQAPPLTVPQLQKTTSDLGKLVRSLTESAKNDPSKYNGQLGLAKKLHELARTDLERSLAGNPSAEEAYHKAIEITRLGNERYFNDAIMDVVKQNPEKVATMLSRPNSSTAIRAVRAAVGDEGIQPVQRRVLEELTAPDPKTRQIEWGTVASRLDAMGDDTLTALFPGSHATEVRRLSRLMLNLEQQNAAKGIGRQGIYLTQWGPLVTGLGGLVTGTLPPAAAGGVLLGPVAIQRIMTSPTGLKWLTTGLRFPPGTEQAVKSAAMLTAFLRQEQEPPMAVSHDRQ